MSDSFLDRLAGPEKQRIIKRLRSPEAYERLRSSVKGPEDLERALDRAEKMAELHFALESDPSANERMKDVVARAASEGGADAITEHAADLSDATRTALQEGRFRLAVMPDPETHDDQLVALPEGNVAERVPVNASMTESCVYQLSGNA